MALLQNFNYSFITSNNQLHNPINLLNLSIRELEFQKYFLLKELM